MTAKVFEALLDVSRTMRRERRRRLMRGLGKLPLLSGALVGGEEAIDVRAVRSLTGLSQTQFAELIGIEPATLRNWEQGRRVPTGPARALLRAIRNNPIEVLQALNR